MRPGPRNLITDIAGLRVGQSEDARLKSGVTVVTADAPFTAAVHVMGGAPGTRETDLLAPDRLVQEVDALVLSGGSALGLSAASGVADAMRAAGRGFDVGGQRVPIVPSAILFDLLNGGDKGWDENPYPALGAVALGAASAEFALGSVGAGAGATTADLKGGLGSASVQLPGGAMVGALVAVNAVGSVVADATGRFHAATYEWEGEFGGRGVATEIPAFDVPPIKGAAAENTTIAIVATDVTLSQAQATRVAVAAHDGLARAIVPAHTLFDGDLVFAAATGARPAPTPEEALLIGHSAALCLTRAVARGVFAARTAPGDTVPTWQEMYGATG